MQHMLGSDSTCWITPEFCKTENLPNVAKLVKLMIQLSVTIRKRSDRNDILNSYSVQMGYYVIYCIVPLV